MFEIFVEVGEVLHLARTSIIVGDGVEQDQGIVLADVLVGTGLGVKVALVASVRNILLVLSPRNVLGVKQIGDGGDVIGFLLEVIIVQAEVVTSSRGKVIGLRRVGGSEVVCEENTLLGQCREIDIVGGGLVVLLLAYVSANSCHRVPPECKVQPQCGHGIGRLTVFSIQICAKRSKAKPLTLETGE